MARSKLARLWCCLLFLLIGSNGFGQYTGTKKLILLRNYAACSSSVAASTCWTPVASAPALSQVSVGYDGTVGGIKSGTSYLVYNNPSTNTWTTTSFSAKQVVVVNSDLIFYLGTGGHINQFVPSTGANTYYGSPYPSTIKAISVDKSGTSVWMLDTTAYGCGYRTWNFNTSTNSWTNMSAGLTELSAVNPTTAYGVCSNGSIFKWTAGAGWATVGGSLSHVAAAPTDDGTDQDSVLFGLNSGDYFEHQNSSGWDTLTGSGSLNALAAGSENFVFGLFGTTLEKFSTFSIQFQYNLSGSYSPIPECEQGNPEYKGECNHTINISAGSSYYGGTLYTSPINVTTGSTTLSSNFQDTSCEFDDIQCFEENIDATVSCTVMGATIFSDIGNWYVEEEPAKTRLIANGGLKCTTILGVTVCTQPVLSYCENTSSPDLDPPTIITAPPQWTETWDDGAICFRFHNGTTSINSAWACSPGVVIKNPTLNRMIDCTYHP